VIGYNLAFTFVASNIDIWGHLGGLLAGIVLGWRLMPRYMAAMTDAGPRLFDTTRPRQWAITVLSATALLVLLATVAVVLRARITY